MSKVLFLANHFITLFSFRKELIQRLIDDGHELFLSLPKDEDNKYFEDLGCKIVETDIDRRGVNPFKDIKLIKQYKSMMKTIQPDIVFSYTIKPNIYGCMASNKLRFKQVCNVTGTGATFLKRSLVSSVCKLLYKHSIKKCYKVFFQNVGDRDFFIKNKLVKENYDLLPGSGCNLIEHKVFPMPNDDIVNFIFIGRVMQLKGIDEYLSCAKEIKTKYTNTRFYIAGWNEEEKYKRIVEEYHEKGFVQYLGFRKDINDWIVRCHCTVLPSHGGEGVPNVLLESAACGRACIGSRINGTISVIEEGLTGYLFESGNANEFIHKVESFINLSYDQKTKMGLAGRAKIEKEFDRNIVINKYLKEIL